MIYRLRNFGLTALLIISVCGCETFESKFADFFKAEENREDSSSNSDPSKADVIDKSVQLEPLPIVIDSSSEQDEVLQIMRYARVMSAYPKSRLKPEFKRLANESMEDASNSNKVQLAILLSIPDTSFESEKRAINLLTQVVNDVNLSSSGLQEYAYVLLETLLQRSETNRAQVKLIQELNQEKQKRIQLQEQLNALKSIEKSISQRQLNTEVEGQ